MHYTHIAGYKFVALANLETWQKTLFAACTEYKLLGTILLADEGINLSLAGTAVAISQFRAALQLLPEFQGIHFHETFADVLPYQLLKVKIKPEIITMHVAALDTVSERAPSISANELKTWLDNDKDFILLDTRNTYEIKFGTFSKATHLDINDFGEFPQAVERLRKDKPVVMFCTGGIRCEKAALFMQQEGFNEVYQLDKGILGYFAEVGGDHYEGECFVFDDRIAVNPQLQHTGTQQCKNCHAPVKAETEFTHHCAS